MLIDILCDAFHAVLFGDNVERKQAEAEIVTHKNNEGICGALAQIMSNGTLDTGVRQLALVTVKNWVSKDDWNAYDGSVVKDALMCILHDEGVGNLVHQTCALTIAKVAAREFPHDWPTLLEDLYNLIGSPNTGAALRTLRLMCEEVQGHQLEPMTKMCTVLLEFAFKDDVPDTLAAQAMNVVELLSQNFGLKHPDVGAALGVASDSLLACSQIEMKEDNLGRLLASLKIVSKVFSEFPDQLTHDVLQSTLVTLENERQIFEDIVLNDNGDEEIVGMVSRITSRRLHLVEEVVVTKKLSHLWDFLLETAEPLAQLLLFYTQVSDASADEWAADASAFLSSEDDRDDGQSWLTRDVAVEVGNLVCGRFDKCRSVTLELACNVLRNTGDGFPDSWKPREAALVLIGSLLRRKKLTVSELASAFPISDMFTVLLETDLSDSSPHLLVGRTLLTLKQLLRIARKEGATGDAAELGGSLLQPTVSALSQGSHVIQVCSCRLMSTLLKVTTEDAARNIAADAFEGLVCMARTQGIEKDALYLCLESMAEWAKAFIGAPNASQLPAAVFDIWSSNLQDPNMGELVTMLFDIFLRGGQFEGQIMELLPQMRTVMQGHANMTALCSIPSLIKIVAAMIRFGSGDLIECVRSELLGLLCQLVLTNEDTAVCETSVKCLATLLQRVDESVSGATVEVTPSALQDPDDFELPPLDESLEPSPLPLVLLAVARLVLSDLRREIFLLSAGDFLSEVARVLPSCLDHEDMERFVGAIGNRLLSVKMDSTVQELAQPVAMLLELHRDPLLDTLGNLVVPMFERWLSTQPSFTGLRAVGKTVSALISLLEDFPPGLENTVLMTKTYVQGNRSRRVPTPFRVAVFVAVGRSLSDVLANKSQFMISEDLDVDGDFDDEDEDFDAMEDADENAEGNEEDEELDEDGFVDDDGFNSLMATFRRILPFVGELGDDAFNCFNHSEQRRLRKFFEENSQ